MGYADDFICQAHTVVIGRKGNINKPLFVDVPFWNVDTAFGLEAKRNVLLPKYLYYFCLRYDFEKLNKAVTIPSLTKADLLKIEIELPKLSIQEDIVSRLESIERVKLLRQYQLRTLDTLIKARFVELFGDPSVNSKSYPERQLGELVINIIPGWSANGESRRMQGAEKAVLKVSAVTQGVFKPEEHKALPMGTEIKKYVYPHKGDLLFSRANTRELVGATAIIDQDYPNLILPDKLWRVLFTNEINVYYAKYVLSTEAIRREFSAQSTGTSGSMFNVSAEKFCAIMIPVPPIHEQELFAAFVSQVDKSKAVVQAALNKAQLLFDSLMQQYFG